MPGRRLCGPAVDHVVGTLMHPVQDVADTDDSKDRSEHRKDDHGEIVGMCV